MSLTSLRIRRRKNRKNIFMRLHCCDQLPDFGALVPSCGGAQRVEARISFNLACVTPSMATNSLIHSSLFSDMLSRSMSGMIFLATSLVPSGTSVFVMSPSFGASGINFFCFA